MKIFSNKKSFIGYIRAYERYLGWKIYLFFALNIFAAISEGFGILMVLPLLKSLGMNEGNSIDDQSEFENVWINRYVDPWVADLEQSSGVIAVLLVISLAFLIKGILNFCALSLNVILATRLMVKMKEELFYSSIGVNYQNYLDKDSGYYISLINDQTFKSVEAFKNLSKFSAYFINTIIYILLALSITWKFGVMITFAGIFIILSFRILNSKVRETSRKAVEAYNGKTQNLVETFRSFIYLRSTGQITKFSKKFNYNLSSYAYFLIKNGIFAAFTQALREPLAVILIMFIVGIQVIILNESISPILVAIVLFYRAINSVLGLQNNLQQAYANIGSFEIVIKQTNYMQKNSELRSVLNLTDNYLIMFDNVSFKYNNHSFFEIKNLNLTFLENETVAIIGPSGCGKSTVIGLITGLLKPSSGSVRYGKFVNDGDEIDTLRRDVGYVTQETSLFNDTIFNNISMFADHNPQNLERVKQVAEAANISHFIEELNIDYDTVIGENGVLLSGGQKQRIAIARELYRSPKILILDEATSALDTESENFIQKSISDLSGQLLIVIIAHRLNTIKKSDKIILLEDGKLSDVGSFADLDKNKISKISKLIDKQKF